ncbi:MAG TPA: hypothetical protein VGR28_12700, partial [Candidatus Thermoplasmatota archaeon]|nr:hypothetical protein [Candidatus Thermoplasmatota archaeon]
MAGRLLAGLVALFLLAAPPAALPLAAEPAPPDVAGSSLTWRDLAGYAAAPAWVRDEIAAALPPPLGDAPGHALLRGSALGGPAAAADATYTGDVVLTGSLVVAGNLTFDHATVHFPQGLDAVIEVRAPGLLTVRDSAFLGEGQRTDTDATVRALGPLDVADATFDGVALAVPASGGASPSRVADSAFRDGRLGIVTDRPELVVERSSFANLTTGLSVEEPPSNPELGPSVDDNVFVDDYYGISVSGGAGLYQRNVARGNAIGVSCASPGMEDALGQLVRPAFVDNNLYSNYAEAILGLRGITVTTPLGDVTIASSHCDHDHPYLGPDGDPRDTYFVSADDTVTNIADSASATDAPPLPLPVTVITASDTWTGDVTLAGPVVVNDPATLTLDGATVHGPHLLGAKYKGVIVVQDSTLDPLATVVLRNPDDEVTGSTLGGLGASSPLTMYRCNCTLTESTVATDGGIAVTVAGGLLTDDTVWTPALTGNTLTGTVGLAVLVVKPTLSTNTVLGDVGQGIGILGVLSTLSMDHNNVRGHAILLTSLIDTISSSDDTFEAGLIGYLGILDSATFTRAIYASNSLAMLPVLNTATTISLSNLTYNGFGLIGALGAITFTNSNMFDNYLLALATIDVDTGDVEVPTSISCTNCWAPVGESWHGDVTYTAALAINNVPKPAWWEDVKVAGNGQTIDLSGVLEAPAIARDGGTLRVQHADLDLAQRYPIGAKSGGMNNGNTGVLLLDNATIQRGSFVAVNGTSSTITHSLFRDFPDTAISAQGKGPTITCSQFEDAASAIRFNVQTGGVLTARRIAVRNAEGVTLGLVSAAAATQSALVEDSSIRGGRGDGLLHRLGPGDAQLHRSNLLVPAGDAGAGDDADDVLGITVTAFN